MKSTLVFSMLCHNTKIVQIVESSSHAQKYLQIHTHAGETFFLHVIIFHQTSQHSATYAQQIYLYGSEQKYAIYAYDIYAKYHKTQ